MNQSTLTKTFHTVELDHLEDAEVPVISGMQRQGDILVFPMRDGKVTGLEPIGPEGVVIVRGEAGGNTHVLRTLSDSGAMFAPRTDRGRSIRLGTLVVPEGDVAYLDHLEHGFTGIGPGTYGVTRSRTQADEIRILAD